MGDSAAPEFNKGVCIGLRRAAGSNTQRRCPSGVHGCMVGERRAVLGSCSPERLCFLQVASTLTRTSLVPQNQPVKVLSVDQVSRSLLVGLLGVC